MPATVRRLRRTPGWAAIPLLVLLACGGTSSDGGAPSPSTGLPATSTTADPGADGTPAPTPVPATAPGPSATKGPKTITFGPLTFHAPAGWDIDVSDSDPTTAYVGVLAGGPGDVNLRVMTAYTGSVDALQPANCLEYPVEAPTSVELVDSGFAPVGDRNAEFRRWRLTCVNDGVEEHGAWLLPVSHLAIVEQFHTPQVADVVATAEVA